MMNEVNSTSLIGQSRFFPLPAGSRTPFICSLISCAKASLPSLVISCEAFLLDRSRVMSLRSLGV
ncbi:MAG: hypothetical protein AW07_03788 [Candidatus Accumulibacter sp. SK-11]|nr:MAG: hypothetical protein AW07_03788 [Candidatus Accumulibacter sp. SK-11]